MLTEARRPSSTELYAVLSPGRPRSGRTEGADAGLLPAGCGVDSATETRPQTAGPGTALRSDCSPPTHLQNNRHVHRDQGHYAGDTLCFLLRKSGELLLLFIKTEKSSVD